MRARLRPAWATLVLLLPSPAPAQPVVRDVFPPEEYAARRDSLFDAIGDGVAVLQGTTERPGALYPGARPRCGWA